MNKAHTLYTEKGEIIMVASIATIERYIGQQIPRTAIAREQSFRVQLGTVSGARWFVIEGAGPYDGKRPPDVAADKQRYETRALVQNAVYSLTPEQVDALTDQIIEAKKRGDDNCSVWHQSAIMFGNLDRCSCSPCRKARGEEGPSPFRTHMLR